MLPDGDVNGVNSLTVMVLRGKGPVEDGVAVAAAARRVAAMGVALARDDGNDAPIHVVNATAPPDCVLSEC